MILHYLPGLCERRIVLASASPRRKELLSTLGLKFEVMVSSFDETLPKERFVNGAAYALETARHKALDVARLAPTADLVVAADTVVEHEGVILEKPADDEDARRMLTKLGGSQHQVHTGVVLVLPQTRATGPSADDSLLVRSFSTTTDVIFDTLPPQLIDAYIATGEPFGKAGSYGIQGPAGSFVSKINGCYFNVVGFPIHDFCVELKKLIEEGSLKV